MTETSPGPNSPLNPDASLALWLVAKRKPILVLAALAALFWTLLYLQYTVDDAWISFRYGRTLVTSHVWNWNPSGPREEAYTSAIYTALGIIPAVLHLSPALFFKIFGLACIGAILYRLRTAAATPFAFLLGLLLLALHPWVWIHAYSGLETPLYMLLILELAICVHRGPTVSAPYVYALALLLPLTRPEGIVFAFMGVLLFWRHRGDAPKQLPWLIAAVAAGLLYFLVRWHYFGHLLPNPYYSKVAQTTFNTIRDSLLYNFSQSNGYFLTLILLTLLAQKLYTRIFALAGILVLLLLYGTHLMLMNYADRFYFQVTFPILLFFLIAEDVASSARIACILAAVFLVALTPYYLREELHYYPSLRASNVDLGKRLAPFAANHTLFTGDAGAIPYYANWFTYDFFGLGTNRIAREGVTLAFMQQHHPDLILIESPLPDAGLLTGPPPSRTTLWSGEILYLRQSNEYEYAGATDFQGFYLAEFLRKDTPQRDEILAALKQNTETSAQTHLSLKDLLLQRYVPWSN
jgi:arabinofuranosyltransferase